MSEAAPNGLDGHLVLGAGAEGAYQLTADRFNTMWAQPNGLNRFLYWPRAEIAGLS